MNILNENQYYPRAKRTALLAHDKVKNEFYHVYSVIELIPQDIPDYSIPRKDWHYTEEHPNSHLMRSHVSSDNYTFYLVIQDFPSTNEAILAFENPINTNQFDGETIQFFNSTFHKEPEGSSPLVISSNVYTKDGLPSVIPQRKSDFFVWAQIDSERSVEKQFRREKNSSEMKAMSQLTEDFLGFNIWEKSEHIGNIYLVAPNPYYRALDVSLSKNPTGIFYQFHLRKGIKAKFKIQVIDKHGDNIAFDSVFEVKDSIGLLTLPHEPHMTEFRVFNTNGDIIGTKGPFTFVKSIGINFSVKQADFHVIAPDKDGIKEYEVEKYSNEKPITIGESRKFNAAYYFKDAVNRRKHITLDSQNEFIFFQGGKSEEEKTDIKAKAKERIGQIINTSNDTCFLCDPYFSFMDLIDYAFKVRGSGVKIRILNKRGSKFINRSKAQELLNAITQFNSKPFEKIECRMLKENLLHDRFIISDLNVWYLGSSFNEFGNRATCIGKVPESSNIQIIAEIERWFYNDEYTQTLADYINMIEDD